VAFYSEASNLVVGDTNDVADVFLRDRLTGETTRISVSTLGAQGDHASGGPDISADGRYVVFHSLASNLVDGDNNWVEDIFMQDLVTKVTTRLSLASDGTEGNGRSTYPSISANGRFVTFQSLANNLVAGDNNGVEDIFVHDRLTGETTRVSVASDGTQGDQWSDQASISPDGLSVVFRSYASNLVQGDVNNVCDTDQDGVFDDNCQDIFLHRSLTGETILVSVASDGTLANNWSGWPSVSLYGRYVVFQSWAEHLVENDTNAWSDIFVHDTASGETTRVSVASDGSQADNYSVFPSISANGRFLTFYSCASNLVDGDTNGRFDIFIHDRITGRTDRVSIATDGTQADSDSVVPNLSAGGRYVAFTSYATNLVPGDTNAFTDDFVHDRGAISTVFLPLISG
jgi:Tol biopolymer transport system component